MTEHGLCVAIASFTSIGVAAMDYGGHDIFTIDCFSFGAFRCQRQSASPLNSLPNYYSLFCRILNVDFTATFAYHYYWPFYSKQS